jgi:hypothetical protein
LDSLVSQNKFVIAPFFYDLVWCISKLAAAKFKALFSFVSYLRLEYTNICRHFSVLHKNKELQHSSTFSKSNYAGDLRQRQSGNKKG